MGNEDIHSFKRNYDLILSEIKKALGAIEQNKVDYFIDALLQAEKVFFIGVGRVMLSLQAIVKRLNHLGIKAWYVGEVNEPAITDKDLLVIGSGSGESVIPLAIAKVAKRYGAKIAHIGSNPRSPLVPLTDIFVRIPVKTRLNLEEEIESAQIMSSLFEQSLYIFGDAIALEIIKRKNISDIESLWAFHAKLE